MMKKFLVAIVAVLFAAPSFAQYSSGGFTLSESTVYYGARVGLNLGWISGDVDGYGSKAGMNIGGVLGLRVSDATPVFLESGLYFAMQGAKDGKNEINLNYLEIPLLIKYGVQVTDDIALLPYLGPTFGLGIAGKKKPGSTGSFSSEGGFNRPDVGIKFGCGAEFNKLYLETGLKFGVTNILDDDNDAAHNGAWYINFGVNF
jgi:hypothetical protein